MSVFAFAGAGGLNQNTGGASGPNDTIGQVQVELVPWEDRAAYGREAGIDLAQLDGDVVLADLEARLSALPGIKADEVQINVTGEVLTLKGEMKHEEEVKEKAYHIREQRFGSFERSIILPTDVVADKAKADFENAVHELQTALYQETA